MKKIILAIITVMILAMFSNMLIAYDGTSKESTLSTNEIPQYITLNDGSIITKHNTQSMTIANNFLVNSSTDMQDVGDIRETKEWGYVNPGFDVITSEKELEIINEEYVCIKENTLREIVASANEVTISKTSNPTCIHYPKKLVAKGTGDNTEYTNLVTISQIADNSVRVDYPFENYDPTIVNYTGNCSNAGGCNVTAAAYSVYMIYGAIQTFKAIASDNHDLDWCDGGSTSSCSAIYSDTWRMSSNISATCTIIPQSDYLYMNCSNAYAEQHFYFYDTYIKTEITAFNAPYRYYWYTTPPAGNATAYTTTGLLPAGVRWTDSDSSNGIVGMATNTSVATSYYNTTYILAIAWNESIETDFAYGAGVNSSGIALFRNSNVPANVWMTSYIKFIPRNESGTNMTRKYTSALNAFKNNCRLLQIQR